MKKSALAIFAVLFGTMMMFQTANAQKQFTIGIKGAMNRANYNKLTKSDFGADAGIFMRFGNGFFFQPEVNYAFKSSTFNDAVNEFSTNIRLRQHYISVPALLGYHFIDNNNFKFRLTLGPRFDFKIADNTENGTWESNNLQWGGQVGVGIDFWRFTLDFSYCLAADNFRRVDESSSQTKRANIFTTSLGFKFIK